MALCRSDITLVMQLFQCTADLHNIVVVGLLLLYC